MDRNLLKWGETLGPARLAGGTVTDPPAPIALDQAYRLADRAAASLGRPAGWKIGATSPGAMAFLKVTEPIRGRLFAERLWLDGAEVDLSGDRLAEAEPEIAFHLSADLRAGADPRTAVGEIRAAAEIVRPSHPRAFELGAGFIVADNAAGLGALLGPVLPLEQLDDPAELRVSLSVEGGGATVGTADAVLGNPLHALAWLAQALGHVPAGSWVLSGAMARAVPLHRGPDGGLLLLEAGSDRRATLLF